MNYLRLTCILVLLTLFVNINKAQAEESGEKYVIPLNQSSFNESISEGYVLVDFWAAWCRPCLIQKPILEEVAEKLKGKIKIASVNTEENRALAQSFNIRGIPCMILFKDGKEVKRLTGLHRKDRLMEELKDYY